jgi:DNA polymerase/3'-5' exonuclease PolX
MATIQRHPLKAAAKVAEMITDHIIGGGHTAAVAGSIRRHAKTVGDIDIITITKNLAALELPPWMRIVRGGGQYRRYAVSLENGTEIGVDIWACPSEKQWGGYLLFATGTAGYNIFMRREARKYGYLLNQAGLWKNGKHLALTEHEISRALGLPHLTADERNRWERHINTTKKGRK